MTLTTTDDLGSTLTSTVVPRPALVSTCVGGSSVAPPSQPTVNKTSKGVEKKVEKKERPPSPWKIEDYLKDEDWFRDVIGLPGAGNEPAKVEVVSEQMDLFYGKKVTGGYPFKASKGCVLTQVQKEEILHFKLFTDGVAKVPNDVLLVGFAKAYFIMRHLGKPINWARLAAAKHRGQLENQLLSKRQEPTPGSGIRDQSIRYFPFPGLPEIVATPNEANEGDGATLNSAPLEPLITLPPSSTVESLGLDVFSPSDFLVNQLPPSDTTPLSQEPSITTGSTQHSRTCAEETTQPVAPTSGPFFAGSLKIAPGNFSILDEYVVILQKEADMGAPVLEKARADYNSAKVQWSEAASALDQVKANILAERNAFLDFSEKKAKCDKEADNLRRARVTLEEVLDRLFEKANEAVADVDDGVDTAYYEECDREFQENTLKFKQLERELDLKITEGAAFAERLKEARCSESKTNFLYDNLANELDFLTTEVERLGENMQKLINRQNHLRSSLAHFESLQSTLNRLGENHLTPSMVPSPIKNQNVFFRISNCPVCDLGFGCLNFMPTSCGHAYHPACGLAYFQSQVEPRCRACEALLHPTWLRGWGIPLGSANMEMEAHLGQDIHERQLLNMDHSLRKDPEAFDELQYWNSQQRRSIINRFTAGGNRTQITENSVDFAMLKDGFQARKPCTDAPPVGPTKLGSGTTKIAQGKVVEKEASEAVLLLVPKLENGRGDLPIDSPSSEEKRTELTALETPPETIVVPIVPPVTRSQAVVAGGKKRTGVETMRTTAKKGKESAKLPKPPTSRHLSYGSSRR